ncbi:MAG TPA: hypothetical protein VFF65_03660, partial [Phycisphaerales bacterium]|nr:hypothetical protein [Phycisphaerales bacterium]
MRSLYRCTAAAAAGSAVLALGLSIARAQTQDVPKLWAEFYPRGAMGYDSRGYQPIDQNPILHRMVMLNAAYPSINWHTLPPPGTLFPGLWSPSINDAVDSDNQPAPGIPNVNLVARRLALESLRRGFIRANYSDSNNTARDLALNLIRTGMPRSEVRTVVSGGPQTVLTSAVVISLPDKPDIGGPEEDPDRNNYIEFPDLYAAQTPTGDDTIVFNRGRFPACAAGNTRMRTVWMQAGIIDTRAWVQRVVTQYNAYSNPENSDLAPIGQAAYPSRVVFDQEPALILMSQPLANECEGPEYALMDLEKLVTWRDCVEYWAALQADLRWQWMPVPGCNGQTMAQLWAGRDLAQFETPGNPNDDEPDLAQGDSVRDGLTQVNPLHFRWIGGSARNQAWYRWFCMINQQAYIGALDEAAFSVIRQHWPNAWCSDYDACRTSGFGLRAYTGVQGPQGLNFPVEPWYGWWDNQPNSGFVNPIPMTQDPAAANVQNAPHIYSDVSAWQWDKFSVQHSQHPDALRWGNTGDAV